MIDAGPSATEGVGWVPMLRAVRRSIFALGAAGVIALWLKFRGNDDMTPPEEGGWRELSGPDLK